MLKKFHIYLADLDPTFGAEAGKLRPVVIIQSDDLNDFHPTTVVCPVTTNIKPAKILRVHLTANNITKLSKDSDIMIDQIRCIDAKRIKKSLGQLCLSQQEDLMDKLEILFD